MKTRDAVKQQPAAERRSGSNVRKLRTIRNLVDTGLVSSVDRHPLEAVVERFALSITSELASQIKAADDPIGYQFIPNVAELSVNEREMVDPIGDNIHERTKGLIHRYPDRVLLILTHICPVYCRFCFRREKVGPGPDQITEADLKRAVGYIDAHPQIWEVILSGGDPFSLSDNRLRRIFEALHAIEHVDVIRVHTRYPVADPDRITDTLGQLMMGRAAVYVVVHCNHPRELTAKVQEACSRLIDRGIPMLSQTVLLRGVNDDATTLTELMRKLVRSRIKPYYLHHLDLARGTGHFRTTVAHGQQLMRQLRGRVSGLCQPTYVLDLPGGYGKVPIGPEYIHANSSPGEYEVVDYNGNRHSYTDVGLERVAQSHET